MVNKRAEDPSDLQVESMRKNNPTELIYKIWVILSGNGNPQEGMISKVNTLMEFKLKINKAIDKIVWCAAIGASSVFCTFLYSLFKDMIQRGKL